MASNGTGRRRFLSWCTDLLLAALGLLVAVPALIYFCAPLRRKPGEESAAPTFQDVGPLSDFPVGQWSLKAVEVERRDGWKKTSVPQAIWVRRQGEGEVTVLSSICPHLGCPINWHPDRAEFVCPCHGGVFNASGRQVGGPPPRPMDRLDAEVRAGRLWVRWQDFKIGVAERIPVNA
jgi:Rieske Fe-S protein